MTMDLDPARSLGFQVRRCHRAFDRVLSGHLAPAGIILTEPDGIIATGALVAAELYGVRMPIVTVSETDYASIEDGVVLRVEQA